MGPKKFEPCIECGVSTDDECEICNETLCDYCVDEHNETHEENDEN